MARFFNTAGPCHPAHHYMLPPERRLPRVGRLLDQLHYFVVHAPRQTGKTTSFQALARRLTGEGRLAAVHASCETGAVAEVDAAVLAVVRSLEREAALLPEALRPPPVEDVVDIDAHSRLLTYLTRWCQSCPLPVALFLDEIDALRDEALLSVLRQLRAGYPSRPGRFPASLALVGLRDVRDYRARVRADRDSLGTSSPFNIKVESITLRNFTADEVGELYGQHTAETGQVFTEEAIARAYDSTRGQPWLVNALAAEAVGELAPDPATPVTEVLVDEARERLILRRDTHIDSLVDRLREPRVQRILEPILAGEFLAPDMLHDDVQFVKDLGLVVDGPAGLEIANPIYREVIPRALTGVLQESLPTRRAAYVGADGSLDFDRLLDDFRAFWCEHAEFFLSRQPYSEAAAQLIFMGYLQRIVNGGGFVDREYGVGSGRIDLCVRWPHPRGLQRHAVELKAWRDHRPDPFRQGVDQLGEYLARLGLDRGTLILFDLRSDAPALPGRCSREVTACEEREIVILRL